MKQYKFLCGFTALLVSGCAAQLNSNALDLESTYKDVLTKQILHNLGAAIDNPTQFWPSQTLIVAGGAQTMNGITPSITVPLPAATLSQTVAGATTTKSASTAIGNVGFGLNITDSWQLSWTLNPRTDPDELRRLRALYLYAVGRIPLDFPACIGRGTSAGAGQPAFAQTAGEAEACFMLLYVMQGGQDAVNPVFTKYPSCVLCNQDLKTGVKLGTPQSELRINPNLKYGFVAKSGNTQTAIRPLGAFGFTKYFVSDVDDVPGEISFGNFVLFVLESMSSAPIPTGPSPAPPPKPGAPGAPREKGQFQPFATPSPPKTQSNGVLFAVPLQ